MVSPLKFASRFSALGAASRMARFQGLESAGIQLFFNGPESFTPDDRYLLGETPEVADLFVACGFNSIGIQSAGEALGRSWPSGLSKVDHRWIFGMSISGEPSVTNQTKSFYGKGPPRPWAFYTTCTGHTGNTRLLLSLHQKLLDSGAVMGEVAGFERPNWYAFAGESKYRHTYGKPNWFVSKRVCPKQCRVVRSVELPHI